MRLKLVGAPNRFRGVVARDRMPDDAAGRLPPQLALSLFHFDLKK